MALMCFSTNYWAILVLIGLFGLGLATVTASTSALVADLSRRSSYGSSLGILASIMDVGHSAGPMAAGVLIGAIAYLWTFGIIGAAMAVIGLVYTIWMQHNSRYIIHA